MTKTLEIYLRTVYVVTSLESGYYSYIPLNRKANTGCVSDEAHFKFCKFSDYFKSLDMGGKEGVLDLDSFVAEQLKLLGLEREAEIAEASAMSCLAIGH